MIYKTKDLVSFRYSKQNRQMCTYNAAAVHSTNFMWQAGRHFTLQTLASSSGTRNLNLLLDSSQSPLFVSAKQSTWVTAELGPPVSNSMKTAAVLLHLHDFSPYVVRNINEKFWTWPYKTATGSYCSKWSLLYPL